MLRYVIAAFYDSSYLGSDVPVGFAAWRSTASSFPAYHGYFLHAKEELYSSITRGIPSKLQSFEYISFQWSTATDTVDSDSISGRIKPKTTVL